MTSRSRHYGDVSKWIENVIDSCETIQQTFTADKLISNFMKQLKRDTPDKYKNNYQYEIIWPLENRVDCKRNEILKK